MRPPPRTRTPRYRMRPRIPPLSIAGAANCPNGPCGFLQDDDIALIWLRDQSQTQAVASYLNANSKALFIQNVLAGDSMTLKFNDPLSDARTPDLMVQPE